MRTDANSRQGPQDHGAAGTEPDQLRHCLDARPALAASMHMFHPGQVNLKQQIIALDSRVTHLANELRRKVNKV